ncbi:MAG: B12-binding domain-containing radical SAM protein [Oscillospiraceae bacterium]|nr:B12-binding domain-containing radical SAM protein [Oscillospiraceae bacterium]
MLAINAKYVHSSLSAWILAESIPRFARVKHDVEVVEATINQSDEEIVSLVAAQSPDVVGISTYIWNAGKLPKLLELLRKLLPETVFVLGGPEATHNTEYWLANGADFVARGEGERSFPALLDELVDGETPNPIVESIPIDEFSNPCSEAYFASLKNKIAYLETSRGCPFSCAFCLSAGTNVRFMPIDKAFAQIDKLSKSGVRTIKFVDRTFNCDKARAYEIFEYVIDLDTDCCFHFEVAADLFDERTITLLSTAPHGRIQFEAGLQSFFPPALEASSRKTDLELAKQNLRALLRGDNIHIHVDLIAGLPYETLPDLANSFDRAYKIGAHHLQLGFLKLLHGSKLREQYENIIIHAETPPYEVICSPWLSADDLKIIKHTENALQRTYNQGRFLSTLKYVLETSNLRPFSLYRGLGEFAPNHGMHLDKYAELIYEHFATLPNVNPDELRDCMTVDWLERHNRKNMPNFLKNRRRDDG